MGTATRKKPRSLTQSRRRREKSLGGDEVRSVKLFAKLVTAVERGGVTKSFPSELARENFSDTDLRTLIVILQPTLKPSSVVDKRGDALEGAALREQLHKVVKRVTRRSFLSSLVKNTKTLFKYSSGTTIAAGVGYMVFTLASSLVAATAPPGPAPMTMHTLSAIA